MYIYIYIYTHTHTHILPYCMEQIASLGVNRFADSQQIPRILWTANVHYRIRKCPPPIPILNHHDPVITPTSHLLKIHLNVIFPSTPASLQCSLSHRFPHQSPVCASPFPIRATCLTDHIFIFAITRTILGENYRTLSSSLCSFLHSPVSSSLLRTKCGFSKRANFLDRMRGLSVSHLLYCCHQTTMRQNSKDRR
jgi:hypothetical protein